ncbi:CAP domain-containing protein [Maribacter chungangensis]|uniref:CAP domain-containing protein n=1 Tax=Maribacter chungangensis TaxID=1069117 RepID=A0ABW3B711_9FLAO
MKLNRFYLLIIIIAVSSCSRHELSSLDFEQLNKPEKEIFLVSTAQHSTQEKALFELINNYRLSIALDTLAFEGASYYFAKKHSMYMISQGNTSHDNFAKRAEQLSMNTGASYVAENVAKDYDTIDEAFEAWLESEGHRLNIEGDYTHSAISIKENEEGDLYFTQLFFR